MCVKVWKIQCRQPGSRSFRSVARRASADEALRVWSRLVGRARGGVSGRRGEARLVGPDGLERERVNVSALVERAAADERG